MQYYNLLFAQTYSSGTYGSSAYGAASTTTSGGSAGAAGGTTGGVLTNTGFEVLLAVTLACAIIFVATIVRFWKRRPAPKAK